MVSNDKYDIQNILSQYFGYKSFRPLQEDIIRSVLGRKDTLALLPTGGGKSICYQIPALAMEGVCLVVSPLIALMKDQVETLKKKGVEAEAVFSGMSSYQIEKIFDDAAYGNLKFLYLSPERLITSSFRDRLPYMKLNLIAVDEAHCISQWGYDFRPPYLRIAEIREFHQETPIL
ncbi:MAG TPA: DEAD/DEAH box helicase, partial [Bacteroidales bacterium]|nr:DEAD/DEAH box helicase [Bacteroidales bacterium]